VARPKPSGWLLETWGNPCPRGMVAASWGETPLGNRTRLTGCSGVCATSIPGSFAEDLQNDFPLSRHVIKVYDHDLLPRSQQESSISERYR